MIFDGYHFIYGGFVSREYGLVFGHCDTSEFADMIGQTKSSVVFNKHNMKNYFSGDSYSNAPVTTEVEIVTDGAYLMTLQERRAAERELFYQPGYKKLYVDIADDAMAETYEVIKGEQKAFYLSCRFTNPVKIMDGNGVTAGYKCTMECDCPLFLQDPLFEEMNAPETSVTVNVDSVLNEYIYPKVTVMTGSTGGNITIRNTSDSVSRVTGFAGVPAMHRFTMDSETNYMNTADYARFADRNFIRLLPGENVFLVTGDIDYMKIEYSNRRFL